MKQEKKHRKNLNPTNWELFFWMLEQEYLNILLADHS